MGGGRRGGGRRETGHRQHAGADRGVSREETGRIGLSTSHAMAMVVWWREAEVEASSPVALCRPLPPPPLLPPRLLPSFAFCIDRKKRRSCSVHARGTHVVGALRTQRRARSDGCSTLRTVYSTVQFSTFTIHAWRCTHHIGAANVLLVCLPRGTLPARVRAPSPLLSLGGRKRRRWQPIQSCLCLFRCNSSIHERVCCPCASLFPFDMQCDRT